MFGRVGFAVYLLVLFGSVQQTQRIVLRAIIIVQVIVNIVVVSQALGQCGLQISAQWDHAVAAHATCQSPTVETTIGYVQSCKLTCAIE